MGKESKKMFAETMIINQPPKQVGDYLWQFTNKYICDERGNCNCNSYD